MPSGVKISLEKRALLAYHFNDVKSTWEFVVDNLFLPDEISRLTIKRLWSSMEGWKEEQFEEFIRGDNPASESSSLIARGSAEEDDLLSLLRENRSVKLRILTEEFHELFYDDYNAHLPSISTVYRAIKAAGFTRKRITWFNIRRDPNAQIDFMDEVSVVPPENLVDMDGLVQNSNDFQSKYGWSQRGDDCIRIQITLFGKTYAVMAAYTPIGFICWTIYEGTVSGAHVVTFLEKLSDEIDDDSFLILDNASNQKTLEVRQKAQEVFAGKYRYVSTYSPELKPIERGFSNVKRFIRERDNDVFWQNNPIGLIESAFRNYSAGTVGGREALNHFRIYYDNHDIYKRLNQ